MSRDPRVDDYIAKRQPFARPILSHLRELVHKHAPGAEETLKWGVPHFVLGGQNLAGMAAFKEHATFGFWRDEDVTGSPRDTGAMGSMGRLASLADLPSDGQMADYIAKAATLCAEGKMAPKLDPSSDVRSLAEMYVGDPRFAANYGGESGAAFVRAALLAWLDAQ